MPTARLVCLRIHQRDAALDARERLAAAALAARGPDLVAVLTCHRVECYGAAPAGADPPSWIAERLGADAEGVVSECDEAAARHLMRAACGLDSAIRGEGQVLLQVRRTYDDARASFTLDPLLAELFQQALHVARDLRATTPLGDVRRSVGLLAVDAAVALLPDAASATALVIGAGEVGKLASRALAARVGRVIIANRDAERARQAAQFSGARVIPLTELESALDEADVVISAADTRGEVLTSDRLARRAASRRLVVIDVAVPRSVGEPDRSLRGLVYRSVDDLTETGAALPEDLARAAEERCAAEAAGFMRARASRSSAATIEALRAHGQRLQASHLERALAKLGHLSQRDRRVVESLASGLTNALLHEPTVALKEAPERAATARALFGIRR